MEYILDLLWYKLDYFQPVPTRHLRLRGASGSFMNTRLIIIPAVVILCILGFTVFGERGLLRIYRLNQEKDDIQKKVEQVRADNDRLKREIEALKTNRRYLESIARKEMGLVRSNEIIYQFASQTPAEPAR